MKKKGRSLRKEITILLIVVSLLPIIGISVGSFYTINSSIRADFNLIVENSLGKVSQVLMDNYKHSSSAVSYLAEDGNAKNILKNPESKIWLKKSMDAYLSANKEATSLYMGIADGGMVTSPEAKLPEGFDPRNRDWYKSAINANGQVAMTDPYEDTSTKELVVSFSQMVKDYEGKVVGVIGIDVKLSQITEMLSSVHLGNNGFAAALSKDGTVIAHKDKEYMGKNKKDMPWIEEAMGLKDFTPKVIKVGNESFITFKYFDKGSSLTMLAFLPENQILKLVIEAMLIPVIVLVISLIVVLISSAVFSKRLSNPINELVGILDKVKGGDFTEKAKIKARGTKEVNSIIEAVNSVIDDMVILLKGVKDASSKVNETSETLFVITKESMAVGEEVAKAVQQIAEGATSQAAELNESVSISNTLGEDVDRSLNNSRDMLEASMKVKEATEQGMKALYELKDSYDKNEKASNNVSQKVDLVAEKSNEISTITDTIKAITEQTNLLALNASIEAARAGEAGRGFAVVAEEIRKLAEESADSAENILKVVTEIKESVRELYEETRVTMELNEKTRENVEVTDNKFNYITEVISELEEDINDVGQALQAINNSRTQVATKISEVATVSEETAATTEEVSASSEEQASGLQETASQADRLNNYAEELEALINKFKIE